MTPYELVGDALQRIGNREVSILGFQLREEYRLEHEIAELFAQRPMVVTIDCLEHLVRLFEHERLQRVDRLLAIPGTAIRSAQRSHDRNEACELFGGAGRRRHLIILGRNV
jgi:hypothetical protein